MHLHVKVITNAKKNQIVGMQEGVLKIRLHAIALKGKANASLIDFLSDFFNLSKSQVSVRKGLTNTRKTIEILGLSEEEVMAKIQLLEYDDLN